MNLHPSYQPYEYSWCIHIFKLIKVLQNSLPVKNKACVTLCYSMILMTDIYIETLQENPLKMADYNLVGKIVPVYLIVKSFILLCHKLIILPKPMYSSTTTFSISNLSIKERVFKAF